MASTKKIKVNLINGSTFQYDTSTEEVVDDIETRIVRDEKSTPPSIYKLQVTDKNNKSKLVTIVDYNGGQTSFEYDTSTETEQTILEEKIIRNEGSTAPPLYKLRIFTKNSKSTILETVDNNNAGSGVVEMKTEFNGDDYPRIYVDSYYDEYKVVNNEKINEGEEVVVIKGFNNVWINDNGELYVKGENTDNYYIDENGYLIYKNPL